ncbi:hypothetical protein BGZ61DRAFT_439649 [Ilyonectria robusta]|uniref:uncharacterized protein n=1 Tax=Ilyonectria robusta TaxID=1079257 RepID=UPI001E8E0583|nr:uncharacterized protein BGZ61DRAFT_439649 [Ilyonectria robusta]KAH8738138.1 hypothetical protein BGZ61DRAFT_439649 [Ilyonectria robusta]
MFVWGRGGEQLNRIGGERGGARETPRCRRQECSRNREQEGYRGAWSGGGGTRWKIARGGERRRTESRDGEIKPGPQCSR